MPVANDISKILQFIEICSEMYLLLNFFKY